LSVFGYHQSYQHPWLLDNVELITSKTKRNNMENIGMFIVGSVVFILYLVGYLIMVNKQHQIQKEESEPQKIDSIDLDGVGNWGRFPKSKPNSRKVKIRKQL